MISGSSSLGSLVSKIKYAPNSCVVPTEIHKKNSINDLFLRLIKYLEVYVLLLTALDQFIADCRRYNITIPAF